MLKNKKPALAGFFIYFNKFLKQYWQIPYLCYYAAMSKSHGIDITNIRKFFYLILIHKNASREEVDNFLHDCLKFVFDYHDININNYKIQIHGVKFDNDYQCTAEVIQEYSHPNCFDVYLNYDELVFKVHRKTDHNKKSSTKKDKSNGLYPKENILKEPIQTLFSLMFTSMHEFGHIVQYITHPKYMKNFKIREHETLINLTKTIRTQNFKTQKLIVKQYNKHEMALESISNIERNADYQAHKYCQILFKTMCAHEENPVIKKFFLYAIQCFNKIRQNRYELYRKSDKASKQALKCLDKFGIKKEDLLTY